MSDARWCDDKIQFARLICEIVSQVDDLDTYFAGLCASMDLSLEDLQDLFERANRVWEDAIGQAKEL